MRYVAYVALLLVAGCGRYDSNYQPKLSEQPADAAKYEADRKKCFAEVDKRGDAASEAHKSDTAAIGAFGVLGYAAVSSNTNPDDDYTKTPMQMFDECMATKGYKVVGQ